MRDHMPPVRLLFTNPHPNSNPNLNPPPPPPPHQVRLLFSRLTPADFFHTYGVRLMTEEERGEDPEATEPGMPHRARTPD